MPRPSTTFPEFLRWSRVYVARRRAVNAESRAQAVARLRRALQNRTPEWRYHVCAVAAPAECGRAVIDNPEESGVNNFACAACGCCEGHCQCLWCTRCGDECRSDHCDHCNRCRSCCECIRCNGCQAQLTSQDGRCGRCGRGSCCECACEDTRRNVQFEEMADGAPRFHPPSLAQRKVNPSPRFVACEMETASVKRGNRVNAVVKKWGAAIVSDGSLPSSGFEINTAPAGGDLFIAQIDELCAALNEKQAKVTDACGMHVHINAKDYDFYSLRRLIKVYAKIEDALYKMIPPQRRGNHYCRPCGQHYVDTIGAGKVPKDVKLGVLKTVYNFRENCKYGARDLANAKQHKYHESRYNALNVHSFFYRGTIECRMHPGCLDRDKIHNWGMMWAHILDFALLKTDKDLEAMFMGRNAYESLLAVVATSKVGERLVAYVKERTQADGL